MRGIVIISSKYDIYYIVNYHEINLQGDNIASKKVIEKLGMKFKGNLNVDDPAYSGGYEGELYYTITNDEYNKYNKIYAY